MTLESMQQLIDIMKQLRDPDAGCPWDLAQDFASISPCTIEEAYEVVEAIAHEDWLELRDELGDLLFQTVYHAQMAAEKGLFDFEDVARSITDKMLERHPHVFGAEKAAEASARRHPEGGSIAHTGAEDIASAEAQSANWEEIKQAERARKAAARGQAQGETSLLDGVSVALPALTRAVKLQKRAARVGFDWTNPLDILDKLEEEIGELRAEITAGQTEQVQQRIMDEMGDLLFVLTNLARRLKVDPESALRSTNHKFIKRFQYIEQQAQLAGQELSAMSLNEMENLWQEAKTKAA